MSETIEVEVAFARVDAQLLVSLRVAPGSSALDAVRASGLVAEFPEIDLVAPRLGIFGKAVAVTTVLRAHDRVEIYRPLLADPKEVRRRRAAAGKS